MAAETAAILSSHEAARRLVALRGLLIIAVGALMLQPGTPLTGIGGVVLLSVFALSNLALVLPPLRAMRTSTLQAAAGVADLLLVGIGIHLGGADSTILTVSAALMVLVVALGNYRGHTLAGAAGVGALHSWLVLGNGRGADLAWQLGLQLLFLCSVALYYGHLVGRVHRALHRDEVSKLERKELSILLDILGAVTSSLDVREVSRTIVAKITEIVPALRCSMLFIKEDGEHAMVLASHDDPDLDLLEIDLRKYPEVRRAIETRDPVLIQDVKADPLLSDVRAALRHVRFESVMVVPITFASDVLGTLCLKTARMGRAFTPAEVRFCTAVARASANALKNALLHRDANEEAMRNLEIGQKLSSVLDQSPDLIVTTDYEGTITEFNRGAERLTGRKREETVGRSSDLLLGEDGSRWIERVRERRSISNHSVALVRADGSEVALELNMAVLVDDAGEVRGTVWVGRDVTALKAAQLQLLQAKKLSSIGEVISGVAHELNNPLSAVLGFSQLLRAREPSGAGSRELDRIHEAALRCQKIVQNLLSFARFHKPERKYLGLNGIVEKTLELRRYQLEVHNVEVVKRLEPDLPRTMLDFHQIQQVLLNLINNAQHAMAGTDRKNGRLEVSTNRDGDFVVVQIRDDGKGMDSATLERIFDPFFTTKEQGKGTGLGLSVSYGIVNEHGGRISAQSRLGHGTTFRIELPIHGRPEASASEEREGESPSTDGFDGGGKKVLVVDDEPMIVDLLVDILGGAGYRVDTAANGAEAARKIEAHEYDVVVSDVRMPEMDGIQLFRLMKQKRPELEGHVLFVTGDLIDPGTATFVRESGAPTIAKPLDICELLKAVEKLAEGTESPQPVG